MSVCLALVAAAPAPGPEPSYDAPRSSGSRLELHGWSPDSRLVAYTRHRVDKQGRARPDQRVQRFVEGGAFAGFGRMVGGDVAAYARAHGYVATAAPRRALPVERCAADGAGARPEPPAAAPTSGRCWAFQVGARELVLAFAVGDGVGWRLDDGAGELARHAFDRIYVGFDPELYPAPDGRQAVLVVHLDSGWETDAAIYPLALTRPPDADKTTARPATDDSGRDAP